MLDNCHHLLSHPQIQQVIQIHPNDHDANFFQWNQSHDHLLDAIRDAQIPRNPITLPINIDQSTFGMSPKKHHEVSRMTQYIADLGLPSNVHIVDVGAGQGYLTRALHAHFATPALALDSDQVQTHGSQTRGGPQITGITHRTIHLIPDTLVQAIDHWLSSLYPLSLSPSPVLIVALHACGSLTPDLFRAVLSLPKNHPAWYPAAIVAVGCCYNLMEPSRDFPLSPDATPLPRPLPASAYQMAAQIPDTWLLSDAHIRRTALSIRKVVWRAILGRLFNAAVDGDVNSRLVTETGSTPTMQRLGRLHDSAYDSWVEFIKIASRRIGVDLSSVSLPPESSSSLHDPFETPPNIHPILNALTIPDSHPPNPNLQSRLATLHVLRCLIGPVVESYIILDRVQWLTHQLGEKGHMLEGYTVEAVNLFDQATGSGRNVALVVKPRQE